METNLVNSLITLLAEKQKSTPDNTLLIVGMIIAAVAPTLAAIGAYITSKSAKENTMVTQKLAVSTADAIEKVHVAVNGGRTVLEDKLTTATSEILRLSTEMSGMKVQIRGHEIKEAEVAAVVKSEDSHK